MEERQQFFLGFGNQPNIKRRMRNIQMPFLINVGDTYHCGPQNIRWGCVREVSSWLQNSDQVSGR